MFVTDDLIVEEIRGITFCGLACLDFFFLVSHKK